MVDSVQRFGGRVVGTHSSPTGSRPWEATAEGIVIVPTVEMDDGSTEIDYKHLTNPRVLAQPNVFIEPSAWVFGNACFSRFVPPAQSVAQVLARHNSASGKLSSASHSAPAPPKPAHTVMKNNMPPVASDRDSSRDSTPHSAFEPENFFSDDDDFDEILLASDDEYQYISSDEDE